MRGEVEDWGTNGFAVLLKVAPDELEGFAAGLRALSQDHDQHFHISRESGLDPKLGDIQISVMSRDDAHNMRMTSLALPPRAEIPDPPPHGRTRMLRPWSAGILGIIGAGCTALSGVAAIVTVAGDYRPVLIQGVGQALAGLLALQFSAVIARSWKARLLALVCALFAADSIWGLAHRLAAIGGHS